MSKGAYIVIEGISGTGKSTLAQMLARELQATSVPTLVINPDTTPQDVTTQAIDRLINDPRYPVTNRTEALLYSASKAQSLEIIRRSIETGVTCIVEHSYLSTLVHEYYGNGRITDYNAANEIVGFATAELQPDLVVVLDTPVSVAAERLAKDSKKLDEAYSERVRAGYLWEAKQRNIPVVYATEPIETVFKHLQSHVSTVITTLQPKNDGRAEQHTVQSVADVLAIHPTSAKTTGTEPSTATAVASLEEPAAIAKQPNAEPGRYTIVTSVSVLAEQHLKHIRSVSYDGQFTQTYFDQKDEAGHYRYYIPENIHGPLRTTYKQAMDQVFNLYAQLVTDVTTYIRSTSNTSSAQRDRSWRATTKAAARNALLPLLPVAAKSRISMHIPSKDLERTTAYLLGDTLPEICTIGQQILRQVRKDASKHVVEVAKSHQTDDIAAMQLLADKLLPNTHAVTADTVTLTGYTPRNELEVVADMLYEYSDLPLNGLRSEIASWPYERKLDACNSYLNSRTSTYELGHALETVAYSFDMVCEYAVFCNMLSPNLTPISLASQQLTPRIGYDTPELIEAAGLSDMFAECFDISLGLYSKLQAAGNQAEAQYATLLGHKTRCKVTYSASEVFRFYGLYDNSSETQPSHQKLAQEMHTRISEVHPLIAESMAATQNETVQHTPLARAPKQQASARPASKG